MKEYTLQLEERIWMILLIFFYLNYFHNYANEWNPVPNSLTQKNMYLSSAKLEELNY